MAKVLVCGGADDAAGVAKLVARVSKAIASAGPFRAIVILDSTTANNNNNNKEDNKEGGEESERTAEVSVTAQLVAAAWPAAVHLLAAQPAAAAAALAARGDGLVTLLSPSGTLVLSGGGDGDGDGDGDGLLLAFLAGTFDAARHTPELAAAAMAAAREGKEKKKEEKKEEEGEGLHYSAADVARLMQAGKGMGPPAFDAAAGGVAPTTRRVDVLLTVEWPVGVVVGDAAPSRPSPAVSALAAQLKPRYHFAALEGRHLKRAPYSNTPAPPLPGQPVSVTRFIALGNAGGGKEKFMHALSLGPDAETALPNDCTPSPYFAAPVVPPPMAHLPPPPPFIMPAGAQAPPPQQQQRGRDERGGGRDGARKRARRDEPRPCWFCLSSPEVEKHLVAYVGDLLYVAMAKGPLRDSNVLLVPIDHIVDPSPKLPANVRAELEATKARISRALAADGQTALFLERFLVNDRGGHHMHVQAVGLSKDEAAKVDEMFTKHGSVAKIDFERGRKLDAELAGDDGFLYVDVPGVVQLYHRIPRGARFPMQFGRAVLASVIGAPERENWKECLTGKDAETAVTLAMRKKLDAAGK